MHGLVLFACQNRTQPHHNASLHIAAALKYQAFPTAILSIAPPSSAQRLRAHPHFLEFHDAAIDLGAEHHDHCGELKVDQ